MKRPVRDPITGTYTIKGKTYNELFGSREQVVNGTAYKTSGELTVEDLVMNRWGRYCFRQEAQDCEEGETFREVWLFFKKREIWICEKGDA